MPTRASGKKLPTPPLNRYSPFDNPPRKIVVLGTATARQLAKATGVSGGSARAAVAAMREKTADPLRLIAAGLGVRDLERIKQRSLLASQPQLAITDVEPAEGRIMSNTPFALKVSFVATASGMPCLASCTVEWAGEPFVVEAEATERDCRRGFVEIPFGREQTLPVCRATFHVSLFNSAGGKSTFRTTCAVLPSNPFSLDLSPHASFVTGTFSARGVRSGNAFDTGIAVTLSNGNSSSAGVHSGFHWRFWDGGVGGSLVEEGDGDFGGHITVPAHNTWTGFISFHSPNGSGVFNKYHDREDMTIEIRMTRDGGSTVSGTITCRTMFRFGINATKVAGEDFTSSESSDLGAAVAVTRTIYEKRDVTFHHDNRFIPKNKVGGFEVINSDDEAHDLWDDWSGPDSNDNIDTFVVQLVAIPIDGGGTADGIDGSIPGPTSHDGSDSGVVASKTGFTDGGVHHLDVNYLGMLMGHELGHYLGLSHVSTKGNLMLPSSGPSDTALTYDQYRTIIQHGWVFID